MVMGRKDRQSQIGELARDFVTKGALVNALLFLVDAGEIPRYASVIIFETRRIFEIRHFNVIFKQPMFYRHIDFLKTQRSLIPLPNTT